MYQALREFIEREKERIKWEEAQAKAASLDVSRKEQADDSKG